MRGAAVTGQRSPASVAEQQLALQRQRQARGNVADESCSGGNSSGGQEGKRAATVVWNPDGVTWSFGVAEVLPRAAAEGGPTGQQGGAGAQHAAGSAPACAADSSSTGAGGGGSQKSRPVQQGQGQGSSSGHGGMEPEAADGSAAGPSGPDMPEPAPAEQQAAVGAAQGPSLIAGSTAKAPAERL
jgi:hypothetical protein